MAATGRGRTSPGAGTERYGDAAAVDAVQHVRTSRTPLPRRQSTRAACAGIVIGDVTALICSALIVSQLGPSPRGDPLAAILLGACVISVALALLYHGDDSRPTPSPNHAGAVLLAITFGAWLAVVGTVIAGWSSADAGALVAWWGLAIPLVLVVHAAVAAAFPRALERALIVGSGDAAKLLTRKLERHSEYRIDVTGTVSVASLVNTMDVRLADRVIVAAEPAERDGARELIRRIRRAGLHVDVVPELLEPIGPGASIGRVEGLPMIHLPGGRLAPTTRAVKRFVDIVGAAFSSSSRRRCSRYRRGSGSTRPVPCFSARRASGEHARVHGPQVPHDAVGRRRERASRLHQVHDDSATHRPSERRLQARRARTHHARRPLAAADEPRRAATALNVLAARCRSSARGRASRTRSRLRAASLRSLPRAAGHHRALAGDRARPLDLRRGARHGRRLRRAAGRSGSTAAPPPGRRRACGDDGRRA